MARGINDCTFIGNLGADPELRYTQAGTAVANFNLAVSERWTDKAGETQERTEWVRIVAWDKLAEICDKYLAKGKQIYVRGKLQTREWEDRDGVKKYTAEIHIKDMQMLGAPPAGQQAGAAGGQGNLPAGDASITDDDIPF